jgi:hypothetical protein
MLMMLGQRIVMMEGITCCVWRKASPTPKRPWRRIPPIRAQSSFVFAFSIHLDAVRFQIPSFVPCRSCFVLLCALSGVPAIRWVRVCSRYELLILDDRVRRLENRTFRVSNSSEDRLHALTEIRSIVGCRPLSFSSIVRRSKSPS